MISNEWTVSNAQDGSQFYYNFKTKLSQWEKPDALKTEIELISGWNRQIGKGGKEYYFNSKTKNSTWDMPQAYKEAIEKLNLIRQSKQIYGNQTIHKSYAEPIDNSNETKYRNINFDTITKEELHKLFKEMLRRGGVSSTWKWEDCLRIFSSEDVWKAIKTFQERKQLFNDLIRECVTREKEEANLKRERLKNKFRQMLEEDSTLTSESNLVEYGMKVGSDERWRLLDEREREDLFEDYLDELELKENEEKNIIRESKMKNFLKFLQERNFPTTTKWKEILLNMPPDTSNQDKLDKLTVFSEYINKKYKEEKNIITEEKKFIEFRNRERFRDMLKNAVNNFEINAKTKWKDYVHKIQNDDRYYNLVGQEGSTPMDLFDDLMEELKREYKKNKENLKVILKSNNIKFSNNATFEFFDERLKPFYDYSKLSLDQKKMLFSHLSKKLKEKEKTGYRTEKKAIKKLKSYFRKKKILTKQSVFSEDIVNEIKATKKFNILEKEKIKEIFEEIKAARDMDSSSDSNKESYKQGKSKTNQIEREDGEASDY